MTLLLRLVQSYWSRNVEARLSLVESFPSDAGARNLRGFGTQNTPICLLLAGSLWHCWRSNSLEQSSTDIEVNQSDLAINSSFMIIGTRPWFIVKRIKHVRLRKREKVTEINFYVSLGHRYFLITDITLYL